MGKKIHVSLVPMQMVSCVSIPSVVRIRFLKYLYVQSCVDIEAEFGRCGITFPTLKQRASAVSFSVVATTKPSESPT